MDAALTGTQAVEDCTFEPDVTIDGLMPSGEQKRAFDEGVRHSTKSVLKGLTPNTTYCIRLWARRQNDDVRSEKPSAWACGTTPLNPPLAPLDVRARVPSVESDQPPRISWSAPDQSGHRTITRFTVERQSPPGPNRPWIPEGQTGGSGGMQTDRTFSVTGSKINLHAQHAYRVCAENSGGRACADPVGIASVAEAFEKLTAGKVVDLKAVTPDRPRVKAGIARDMAKAAAGAQAGAATSPAPAAPATAQPAPHVKARLLESAMRPEAGHQATGSDHVTVAPAAGAPATPAPVALHGSDIPARLPRMNDGAIIIVGGKRMRADALKREILALDDDAIIIVGGRQAPAAALKRELLAVATPSWKGSAPGSKSALNPQPLPPRTATTPAAALPGAPGSALQRQ